MKLKEGTMLECIKSNVSWMTIGKEYEIKSDERLIREKLFITCDAGAYWCEDEFEFLKRECGVEFEEVNTMKKAKIIIDGKTYEGELVEVIEEPKFNEPWEPGRGCKYNFIQYSETDDTLNGGVYFDKCQRLCGNMFKTKEIAEFELKRESLMRRMRNFARANGGENNFELFYNYEHEVVQCIRCGKTPSIGAVTFATEEVAEEAIKRYGDEIKELYKEEA